jgi:hypothetical protein
MVVDLFLKVVQLANRLFSQIAVHATFLMLFGVYN